MIKAVIFDLDGTLADTREVNALAYMRAFKEAGIDFGAEDYYQYHGKRWNDWGPALAGSKADRVHKRKEELYSGMLDKIRPIENGIAQWRHFKDSYVCVLATNASRPNARAVLQKLGLSFEHEFFGEDYRNFKEMLEHIIKFLGIDFSQILLIDDSDERLAIAQQLGMKVQKVEV